MNNFLEKTHPPQYPTGSRADIILNNLHVDEWISKKHLAIRIQIDEAVLSATLTTLRRTGWIEYRHIGNRVYEWRKRSHWAEPMDDIVKRGHAKTAVEKREEDEPLTMESHIRLARYHLGCAAELMEKFQAIDDALKNAGYIR